MKFADFKESADLQLQLAAVTLRADGARTVSLPCSLRLVCRTVRVLQLRPSIRLCFPQTGDLGCLRLVVHCTVMRGASQITSIESVVCTCLWPHLCLLNTRTMLFGMVLRCCMSSLIIVISGMLRKQRMCAPGVGVAGSRGGGNGGGVRCARASAACDSSRARLRASSVRVMRFS
jgi:hypothetical protein